MAFRRAAKKIPARDNEACREKIQTTQLLKRLQDHALGIIELNPTQIKAIEILLRKTLGDLSTVTMQGAVEVKNTYEVIN